MNWPRGTSQTGPAEILQQSANAPAERVTKRLTHFVTTRERRDVVVLGSGPAGAATAWALARWGLSVLVLERRLEPAHKVGEALPPDAQVTLSRMNLWEAFRRGGHLPSHAIHSAWGKAALVAKDFLFNPYGPGWLLDRPRLDSLLAEAAQTEGAVIWRGARLQSAHQGTTAWEILAECQGKPAHIAAAFVVDATGPAGGFARARGSGRRRYDGLIAITGVTRQASPIEPVLLLEAQEHGWWYSTPMPDGRLAAAYMTDGDHLLESGLNATALWQRAVEQTSHIKAFAAGCTWAAPVKVRNASTSCLEQMTGPGWCAVGDAACARDPLSGSGVCKAIQSGLAAAAEIRQTGARPEAVLRNYATTAAKEFERFLAERKSCYCFEMRWPASAFWQRRHGQRP